MLHRYILNKMNDQAVASYLRVHTNTNNSTTMAASIDASWVMYMPSLT